MDTAQLKRFAQKARKSLMGTVEAKLGAVLAPDSLARRENKSAISALEGLINEIGKEQVIEKVAYTWFNRFCALRFMDVNHYSKIGIVSSAENQTQPEILAEAKMGYYDDAIINPETKEQINKLLNTSQDDAYKTLLVAYCNSFNKLMPFMFERINDYTELLIPDNLLAQNSVLSQTIETLTPENCKDVEVIGWLYQYYISEAKEILDYELKNKKNRKVQKNDMPAKTQIFTPKWIVSYMVENSVGKLWLESHPDNKLQSQFKYYLEPAEQEDDVKVKLEELKNKDLKPQDIKVLDPACGSGHILVTAFSVLFEIYKSIGYQDNEIPEMILKNNLYGLDICDRAAQLAQFAVMMKAREFDRNIFNKVKELNICSIKDTDWMDVWVEKELLQGVKDEKYAKEQIDLLKNTFHDAKEYGSILDVKGIDFDFWEERLTFIRNLAQQQNNTPKIRGRLPYILKQARIMQQKYECVITNPPYLGSKFFDAKLTEFMTKKYPNSKSDTCVAFIEKALQMTAKNSYYALVVMQSWMFLSSFEKFREHLLNNSTIQTMTHMGNNVMRIAFGTCATVWQKTVIPKYKAIYSWVENDDITEKDIPYTFPIKDNGRYNIVAQNGFHSIPGSPIAYWASDRVREIFNTCKPLSEYVDAKQGIATGDNDRFLRFWHEINFNKIGFNIKQRIETVNSPYKWFPCNKGGAYRKWYGNREYLLNWGNDGFELCNFRDINGRLRSRPQNLDYCFKKGITWSTLTNSNLSLRYSPIGTLSETKGSVCYPKATEYNNYVLGFLNSCIINKIIKIISPTIDYHEGPLSKLPLKVENMSEITNIVTENIKISKDDWDSFETSWDFEQHPLLRFSNRNKGLVDYKNIHKVEPITAGDKVQDCFNKWKKYKQEQFNKLKANEEELNRLFIEIYGLQDEMTPEVDDKDITVALADELRDIKSLLSYAVGCMFGRYSLDEKGLVFAGGEFNKDNYKTFKADDDAIIPILSEHYFSDDITERFKKFIKIAFGDKYYEENLEYIASVLGKKNNETADDTIRNYFLKDFYNDHVKMYQKRPIYWLFSSKNGNFNALIYLHRYNKDTVNRILNNYLREYRGKLEQSIHNDKQLLTSSASDKDKSKAQKEIEIAQKIVNEVTDYERDILYPLATERKEIDLDDGVKVNYLKFGKALKDIGLKAKK